MKKLVAAIVLGAAISACASPTTVVSNVTSSIATGNACFEAGGKYLPLFDECEEISAASCAAMGGSFNECASACRHLPEEVMCTAQCVPVCSFGEAEPSRQPESVLAQLNSPLECNLMETPREIGEVTAHYICQAPGAYLTTVDTGSDPWTADYFTTDSQSTEVTYGPEQVTVVANPDKQ